MSDTDTHGVRLLKLHEIANELECVMRNLLLFTLNLCCCL